MTRFIRHVAKGLLLMTAGYVLQRIGKWMQPRPPVTYSVIMPKGENISLVELHDRLRDTQTSERDWN